MSTKILLTRIRGSITTLAGALPQTPAFFRHGSDVPKAPKEIRLGPGIPGPGLTRLGRIGDRDIPRQVACQQSPPPFFPVLPFDPQIGLLSSLWGHRRNALKMPGGWGQSPHSIGKS